MWIICKPAERAAGAMSIPIWTSLRHSLLASAPRTALTPASRARILYSRIFPWGSAALHPRLYAATHFAGSSSRFPDLNLSRFTIIRARLARIGLGLALVVGHAYLPFSPKMVARQGVGESSVGQTYSRGPLCPSITVFPLASSVDAQGRTALPRAQALVESVIVSSFPELSRTDIRLREFQSKSDYFRTRFSVARYLSFTRMRFFIEINPQVFALNAPEEGVRAIIAHELEHVVYLSRRNRLRLLSLARLGSADYKTRFERRADLGAISRGYGSGLRSYREWLYPNIPASAVAEKRRDYFSPEEIELIEVIRRRRPEMLGFWSKHVPRNIDEIRRQASER